MVKVSGGLLTIFLIVGTVAAGAIAMQTLGFLGQPQVPQQVITVPGAPSQPLPTSTKLGLCQGITTISELVAVNDGLNLSTNYLAGAIRVLPNGATKPTATGTATGGSSLAYATISIPCNEAAFSGTIYSVASSTLNSGETSYSIAGTAGSVIFPATTGDELRITMYDTTGATNTSQSQNVNPSESVATAMNSGESRDGVIYIYAGNDANTQFGTNNDDNFGIAFIFDSVDSAAFTDAAFSMSTTTGYNLVEKSCTDPLLAKASSVDSGNKCWVGRALSTRDAVQKFSWTLRADGGTDPGSTSDPKFYLEDMQHFEDPDGTIKFGAFDSSGTNVGQSQSLITFNDS